MIHSLWRGLLVELRADIVEQGGLRDFQQRRCWVLQPPSGEVEQVKGIGTERAQCRADRASDTTSTGKHRKVSVG
jgi:hypothetical protein